ncbi:signal peptidase II [Companilactobacillus sp. DQM5]|uniref:signal peptidase II n=1 Tax=Companilactobacillus sp. DQM5 TaxID=3463359 RepID=UPI004059A3D2
MSIFFLLIMLILVIADQSLKFFVNTNIEIGSLHNIIPGIISLTNITNNGGAWSILSGNMLFFYFVTIIAVIIIVYLLYRAKKESNIYKTGLVLLLSGTIGNAIDRFTNQSVTDMFHLDFIDFAIFNLADVYITIGVILIIIFIIFIDKDVHK